MRSFLCATGTAALVLLTAVPAGAAQEAGAVVAGAAAPAEDGAADRDFTIKDPRITESSGLAASRAHPGVYWTHNDQDAPLIYGIDSRTGETVATLTMRGVGTPRDMEAVSVGPDGYLYVGDIGDNLDGSWDHVWIYRFPEPKRLGNQTVRATQYDVTYADGARNAEALMVHPKTGRVYIATKREGGGGLYEGPARLSTGGKNVFRRVGEVPWVTDGAFSPDGGRLVLRGYLSARVYDWKNGRIVGDGVSAGAPFQGQAESVTYTADGSGLMFGSEGKESRVVRVDVEKKDGEKPSGDGGAGPAKPGSGGKDAGAGQGEQGSFTLGVLVLGAATALVLGGKRLLRRR
ncbi:WD40 repeat domain-containing protein [Streptomyces sp. ms191]|uniref:WD40 repeat domain-containing protein n=1 Tax=Streptomyces sp. ms191 TaxID=1827978 RepID=UPI0011CE8B9A|nr:WD40 repeat domain-containing protein [Streptomyces sp. ms191]TXS30238.1 WD40 repeat domain-containing protein [Streptomyces sp. ms191]